MPSAACPPSSARTDAVNPSASDWSRVTIANWPQPAGYMQLAEGLIVPAKKRPSWFHRLAMRLVFGWKWKEPHS